jgi:acyl-CoA reductase-like NAD-dependent aldehyde dehydrogenase
MGGMVAKNAGPEIKLLNLELGGKNAFVVFDDTDLERAIGDEYKGWVLNKW